MELERTDSPLGQEKEKIVITMMLDLSLPFTMPQNQVYINK